MNFKGVLYLIFINFSVLSQNIWTGPKMTFVRADNVDWNLPENQDRITDSVWITRQLKQGIYNYRNEEKYSNMESPKGTEWAFGSTDSLYNLVFDSWEATVQSNPPLMLNKLMVLHLLEEDIYIDIKFLSWTQQSGGGFSYERNTDQILVSKEYQLQEHFLYPDQERGILNIEFTNSSGNLYQIIDRQGRVMKSGRLEEGSNQIELTGIRNGIYIFRCGNLVKKFMWH